MELSKREKRKLKLERLSQGNLETGQEHENNAQQQNQAQMNKKKPKFLIVMSLIALIIMAGIGYSFYSNTKPGDYDDFAKCLTSRGVAVYGAIDWCKYTQAQRRVFGNSWKYLDYRDFTELPGIKKTPTWVIDGKWYENFQSFERLSELTGCRI